MAAHYVKTLWSLLLVSGLTSCATITTKRFYVADIHTNADNASIKITDSAYNLPVKMLLERSKKDLHIKLITDTTTRDYTVKSSPNAAFLYGNLLWIYFSPVAYLTDLTNPKRFYYGKSIYLDAHDTNHIIRPPIAQGYYDYFSKSYPANKGRINMVLSLPWVNFFYVQPDGMSPRSSNGFIGLGARVNYFYKHRRFISLHGHTVMSFPIIAPAPISGTYEMATSTYVSISDNYSYKRYSIGYGVNHAKNTWHIRGLDSSLNGIPYKPPKRTTQSVGLTVNGYYQLGKTLCIGVIYRPAFLTVLPTPGFKYEHLISLDFGWKIGIKK